MANWHAEALIIPPDSLFIGQRSQILQLAMKHRVPTMLPMAADAEAGALLSYGQDIPDLYRRTAGYVDKIFKGTKTGELPVEQPTTFLLKINLKTAKALGLKIPPVTLLRADEVIE